MRWTPTWPRVLVLTFILLCSSVFADDLKPRILSASPAITEMIYFLGYENFLVGRSDFCQNPPDAIKKPTIGSPYQFNYEKAKALKAQFVLSPKTSLNGFKKKVKDIGIKLIELEQTGLDSLISNLSEINFIIKGNRNHSKIKVLSARLKTMKGKNIKKSFLYVHGVSTIGSRINGFYVASEKSIYSDILKRIGLNSVTKKRDSESYFLDIESFLKSEPNYIVWGEKVDLKNPVISKLNSKHIFAVDQKYKVPGPRIFELYSFLKKEIGNNEN